MTYWLNVTFTTWFMTWLTGLTSSSQCVFFASWLTDLTSSTNTFQGPTQLTICDGAWSDFNEAIRRNDPHGTNIDHFYLFVARTPVPFYRAWSGRRLIALWDKFRSIHHFLPRWNDDWSWSSQFWLRTKTTNHTRFPHFFSFFSFSFFFLFRSLFLAVTPNWRLCVCNMHRARNWWDWCEFDWQPWHQVSVS